jgi:hypothetical protein
MITTQYDIRMPLLLISNLSLPPGYNALNNSIANPTQGPSRGSNVFVPPGYNDASSFVPTPTQVLYRGSIIPPPPGGSNIPSPSISNTLGGTSHSVTSSFQLPVGGQPQVGHHKPIYGQYIPILKTQPWNFPFQGNHKLPRGGGGGGILNLILVYPLILGNHI